MHAHHCLADSEWSPLSDLGDDSTVFVAKESGHRDLRVTAQVCLEVGSARGGRRNSHQDLAGSRPGDFHPMKGDAARFFENQGSHCERHTACAFVGC
jgi:hypothetical protein